MSLIEYHAMYLPAYSGGLSFDQRTGTTEAPEMALTGCRGSKQIAFGKAT
jgi:hypothetical protein